MYETFDLVLMVNHACNLRCAYCYTGAKTWRSMNKRVAVTTVDRAIRSLRPGGTLELGFFGGEPLLEATLISEVIQYAQAEARLADVRLDLSLTTNGTLTGQSAWQVMTTPGMRLSVSHDGLPEVHDRYRQAANGTGGALQVSETIVRLLAANENVRVSMVVRPDTVFRLPEGIDWLRRQGVRHVDPTLDLWATWSQRDAEALLQAIQRCGELWQAGLPDCSIGWFDEKAMRLGAVPTNSTARCGFGDGQIAVAPSGNLYPCERLIGVDGRDNAMRLPGNVLDGNPHFAPSHPPGRSADPCSACAIVAQCNTICRCSNYIRTGDVSRPDGLLCLLDKACYRETARALERMRMAYERNDEEKEYERQEFSTTRTE